MSEETKAKLVDVFGLLLSHLDERQQRLTLGAAARVLGHGGIRRVAQAAGVAESTVSRGKRELEDAEESAGRVRAPGAGRKSLREVDPGLVPALLALVEPDQRGDPESPLLWTVSTFDVLTGLGARAAVLVLAAAHACWRVCQFNGPVSLSVVTQGAAIRGGCGGVGG